MDMRFVKLIITMTDIFLTFGYRFWVKLKWEVKNGQNIYLRTKIVLPTLYKWVLSEQIFTTGGKKPDVTGYIVTFSQMFQKFDIY